MDDPRERDHRLGQRADVDDVIAAIAAAPAIAPALAALALGELRRGVMTGEGPTAGGRVHFSRTIDAEDAALCERILLAGGSAGAPVSRGEAEILFGIHEAGVDREDGGRFDDLLAKAIAHHALAAAGRAVPPRRIALARATPLAQWAEPAHLEAIDPDIAAWLAARLRATRRRSAAIDALAALLIGAGAPTAGSLASTLDFAA